MLVMKFGGTSVEDATAIRRLAAIVGHFANKPRLIVVSAMGKTTNGLLECGRLAASGNLAGARSRLGVILDHHLLTAREVAGPTETRTIEAQLSARFAGIDQVLIEVADAGCLSAQSSDGIVANGELLSSMIVAAGLRAAGLPGRFVDIRSAMITNADFTRAAVLFDETDPRLEATFDPLLKDGAIPVTQGFIGSTPAGETTTIGRGGSDYSASIIGAALNAAEILIWTDVDGILSTDPRAVPEAIKLRTISFAEASELAYFGARVLHPSTLLPAMKRNIPVIVCNSRRPAVKGTSIVREAPPSSALVKAIAFKRGITVVNVSSDRMLMAHGFLARLFEIFDRYETPIDMVATSEVSVSMTLDDTRHLSSILSELERLGEVSVETSQALICLVGERLKYTPGIAGQIFSAISGINVSMISHGASAINLSFILPDESVEDALRLLHDHFFSVPDPATFEVSPAPVTS
ncbi:MAG: lysine-sensitive aspartokinase 3 [Acidobacteria bacterium]|nr:lysine-sensitive aspartokinase 3 [Acidobacteriota bacterium]